MIVSAATAMPDPRSLKWSASAATMNAVKRIKYSNIPHAGGWPLASATTSPRPAS